MGKTFLAAAAAILTLAATLTADAGEGKRPLGVVELFTSQGCNSCPPADALLADLADQGDIVALAYHIDYWDYLGWKDTLGSPDFTARQYAYRKSLGNRTVYTPQAVLNGRDHVNGASRAQVAGTLERLNGSGEGLTVDVRVTRQNGSVVIEADDADAGTAMNAHVVLVRFIRDRSVRINRGENRGRTIRYVNSVTGIQTAGMWHGKTMRYELPESELMKKGDGCAVLLQAVGEGGIPGPILGATIVSNGKN